MSPRLRAQLRRNGWMRTSILLLLGLSIFAVGAGLWIFGGDGKQKLAEPPILVEVIRGPYVHNVIDEGEVESSNNVEIKCRVPSRNSGGTEIIWVIEEGAWVEEGAKLVELDSSALVQERDQQMITVNTSAALKAQAEADLNAAEIAYTEYVDGTFLQEEQTILGEIFVAEESLSRSVQYARYSQRLAAKGYITAEQLKGDLFAVQKARNDLQLGQKKIDVLRTYTKSKQTKTFAASIDAARARLESETRSHELEERKLKEMEEQISACTILAPSPGQVVHNNRYSSRGNSEFVVEEGAKVREGQTIIKMPDPKKMQVKARINEARVTLVKVGMPVSIEVEALSDQAIRGEITQVNPYAEPSSWTQGGIKEYAAYIEIISPPKTIRPGLTASVKIHVEQREDALQIPVQALIDHYGDYYCLVKNGEEWDTRQIKVGGSNDEVAVIESDNLQPGEEVVMNPRRYPSVLMLPEVTPEEIEARRARKMGSRPEDASGETPGKPAAKAPRGEASPSDIGTGKPAAPKGPARKGPPPGSKSRAGKPGGR